MALNDWLAGIGGGADAINHEVHDERTRQMEGRRLDVQERNAQLNAEIRTMLGTLNADVKRGTTTDTNASRERIAGTTESGKDRRATQTDATQRRGQDLTSETTRRGQDLGDTHYWDSASRFYDNLLTHDATARRGQDLEHGDRSDALDVRRDENADTRRARTALGVMGLKARQKPSLFGDQNPTDFAAEFDRLYNNPSFAASDALDAADEPPSSAPAATSPAAPTRSPLPVRARGAAAAPAPPKGLQVGAVVTLKSGKQVTATKLNADGTFEYK